MEATVLPLALGLFAGVLSTVAGQGGGLFLLLACSLMVGPQAALAMTSPALLLGNLHRAVLFRTSIRRDVALRVGLGAMPGAVLGGLVAGVAPAWLIKVALVGLAALAVARALGFLRVTVPLGALAPAGLTIGAMTGTSGGAGALFVPLLVASGVGSRELIGTTATVAVVTHVGRTASYAGVGLYSRDLVWPMVLLTVAIFAGNALGGRMRGGLTSRRASQIEHTMLVVCVALSVAGLR